jgi:hypothetical protein
MKEIKLLLKCQIYNFEQTNVKLSLSMLWKHMWGVDVYLHLFLTSVLQESEW